MSIPQEEGIGKVKNFKANLTYEVKGNSNLPLIFFGIYLSLIHS